MSFYSGSIWIDKEFKNYYINNPIREGYFETGITLRFYKGIHLDLERECKNFIKWLRRLYCFPIKVNMRFLVWNCFKTTKESERKEIASFIYQKEQDSESNNKKISPIVYIATGKYQKQLLKHGFVDTLYNYFFSIVHELTHYYQWYFYEFEKRTDRSLEIEANSWAYELANKYMRIYEDANKAIPLM